MARPLARRADPVSAAAFTTLFTFDLLRAFAWTLVSIELDAAPTVVVAAGSGTAALAIAALAVTAARSARTSFAVAAGTVVLARLLLSVATTGSTRLVVAGIGTVAGGVALGVLTASSHSGRRIRVGMIVGIAGWIVLGILLGEAVSAPGGGPTWAGFLLAGSAVFALRIACRDDDWLPRTSRPGGGWPWWSLGLTMYVVATVLAPSGRVASATGWVDPWPGVVVVILSGLLVAGAVVGHHLASRPFVLLSVGLVLVGTMAALRPAALVAVAGQALMAAGLGVLMGAAGTTAHVGPRRRAVAGGGLVACLAAMLAEQLIQLVPAPPFSHAVLAVASITVVVITLFGVRPTTTTVLRPRSSARPVRWVAAATAGTVLLTILVIPRATPAPPVSAEPGATLRIVAIDISRGLDRHGRIDVEVVASELDALRPDVLVVNEVDRGSHPGGGPDTLRILEHELALASAFSPATGDLRGNAILSRLRIIDHTGERLPRGRDALSRANILAVIEAHPQRPVTVIGTQLSPGAALQDTRIPQARATAATVARLRDRGLPVVIAGTLNAAPGSAEFDSFGGLLAVAANRAPDLIDGAGVAGVDTVLVSSELAVVDTNEIRLGDTGRIALVVDVRLRDDSS